MLRRNASGRLSILVLVLALGIQAHATAETIVIRSDETWRGTLSSPSRGWNSDAAFDDTSWTSCSKVYQLGVLGRWMDGIWPANNLSDPPRTGWIRRVFTIDGSPQAGVLDWFFDDDGEVYVNGELVFDDKSIFADNSKRIDISRFLRSGANVIAARIVDNGGYHYACAYMEAEYTKKPRITTALLPKAMSGEPYSASFTATGGTPPMLWSAVEGTIPTGFALSSSGILSSSGSPAATPRIYPLVIKVTDSNNQSDKRSVSLVVTKALPPRFVIKSATTYDGSSVTIAYKVTKATISKPIRFDIYRSSQPRWDSSAVPIASETWDPSGEPGGRIPVGEGQRQLAKGVKLPPFVEVQAGQSLRLPYVVVLASTDDPKYLDPTSQLSTYFEKYLAAFVVHGLVDKLDVLPFIWDDEPAAWQWMLEFASGLVTKNGFDYAKPFDWMKDSRRKEPNMTVKSGNRLYIDILSLANKLAAQTNKGSHRGDVVDVHLFGHSRGTVVISQALQRLVFRPLGPLTGSYVQVTLLDPHPASPLNATLCDYSPVGLPVFLISTSFHEATQDPEIVISSGAGVMELDVWFQQTPASKFPASNYNQRILNLWGQDPNTMTGVAVPFQRHDLTNLRANGIGLINGTDGWIGHTEVHEYYQVFVINRGLVH